MLYLYTRPPHIVFPGCILFYAKNVAKRILGKTRGPNAVLESLERGLQKLSIPYTINTKPCRGAAIHILSNTEALRWALREKDKGIVSTVIVGPNMVVLPTDDDSLLDDTRIDAILVVSQWTKDLYMSLLVRNKSKIHIWPSGVALPELPQQNHKKTQCLVFKKQVDEELYASVLNTLAQKDIPYKVLEYGAFKKNDYFKELASSAYMIYLQCVESQGIALQEAWSYDVPTLVWNPGQFTYPGTTVTVKGNISAPYLTEGAGMLFSGTKDFRFVLDEFVKKIPFFTPRVYCELNLSDEASARTYVKILQSLNITI